MVALEGHLQLFMAFSNLEDAIEEGTGKYDNTRRYFINNSTDQDIIVTWAIKEPEAKGHGTYKIRAGEKGGPYEQFLAYHIVRALVSREMQKDGKDKFFGSAVMRKPYEDKYLVEVSDGESNEDPMIATIRAQEREKLLAEMKTHPISEDGYTTSETRRKALKKKGVDEEFAGANR